MLCILLIFLFSALNAQTLLKIHSADLLKQNNSGGKTIYGNVDIEYDIYRVKCDSAVINKDMTQARLFRNIQFSDTSRTIRCNNATLSKTPNGKMAFLTGEIRITEKDFYITGKDASMNEVSSKVTVSDSVTVKYFKFPSALYCRQLEFETKNDIVSSDTVDSVLYIDSLRYYKLFTKKFTYDINSETLDFQNNFKAESHEFSEPLVNYKNIDPAKISQTVKKLSFIKDGFFSAGKGRFRFDDLNIETSGQCNFRQIDRTVPDTVFFKADKITYSELKGTADASGNVNIKKDKMNINTKHAVYYQKLKTAKFFDKPVITYEDHTVIGDSISLLIDEKESYPKEAVIYGNPYYESKPDSAAPGEINYLKGKLMNLWFSDKEISKIIVSKEAEGVYFIRRDKKKPGEASNYLLGDIIEINFKEGDIDNASIISGCEGIYYPGKLKLNALKKKK